MSGTENPPSAPADQVIPGARTAPAVSLEAAEELTAAKAAPLVEKEVG